MIKRSAGCVLLSLGLVVLAAAACSSSDDTTGGGGDAGAVLDGQTGTGADSGTSSSGDASQGTNEAGTDGGDVSPADPCAMVVAANGTGVQKMEKLLTETAAGGMPKDGTYTLKYWGKQNQNVGIAYELQVNLTLKSGNPNTWAVGEYYMAGSHSGGGTFTIDEAAKQITFTKTCGEINVGLGVNVDKAFYSVTTDELKLFNFGLYGGGNILIFNIPL